VNLIISDVDETIADLYTDASPQMIDELEKLLREGKGLFLISGQSVRNIEQRIVCHIARELRHRILVGHCSGAEVWSFEKNIGDLQRSSFYSHYDTHLSDTQKEQWREIVAALLEEFKIETFPTMPVAEFKKIAGNNPLAVMLDDRGPQITVEVVNAYSLSPEQAAALEIQLPKFHAHYDLRIPIMNRAQELFAESGLPITARLAGVFAVDFAVRGITKATAVRYVIENDTILSTLGLSKESLADPRRTEVWGDRFSTVRGGTDRHISEALPKAVRSICFRDEEPTEFLEGYNIVVWDGESRLHHGLLEFLQRRACPIKG
jgi:hydroxymethylpyrimidine pyrophosphatase-like HAD family hydrolase